MPTTTPRAALPLLAAAQAQKHVTHNDALLQLDALLSARFLSRSISTPPVAPNDGDTYLVKATAIGTWTGQNGQIAFANGGAWNFTAPFAGLTAFVIDESKLIVFNGSAWVDYASTLALQNVPLIGVNATADPTNKFAVSSSALLFNNIGNGVQAKFNKNAATDTASVLYQTGFSGRAEIGLTGDDDFHFKVSGDGSNWFEALRIARGSGLVTVPVGQIAFPATQNKSSNVNTLDDYVEGTFTPTAGTDATAPSGVTYALNEGWFTKIGNVVNFACVVQLSSKGSGGTGNVRILGLPYASGINAGTFGLSVRIGGVALDTGYTQFGGGVGALSALLTITEHGSNVASLAVPWANVSNTSVFVASGMYFSA